MDETKVMEVLSGVLDYVEVVTPLLQKQAAAETEVAQRSPAVVDQLIKAGLLKENERTAALEAIKNPLNVLDSLQKTAALFGDKENKAAPPTLGKADGLPKEASAPKNVKVAAMRESPELERANRNFMAAFGF